MFLQVNAVKKPLLCSKSSHNSLIKCLLSIFAKIRLKLFATGDIAQNFQVLLPITLPLSTLYILCHYGNHLTHRFEDVGTAFWELDWYKLPLHLQKDFPFVIAGAQKKVFLRGFAGTVCTREVYKQVRIKLI